MAIYQGENSSCSNFLYEPGETKQCLLLGWHFICGSEECKRALQEEKERKESKCGLTRAEEFKEASIRG